MLRLLAVTGDRQITLVRYEGSCCSVGVSSSDTVASSAGLGVLVHRGLPVSLVHVSERSAWVEMLKG